MSVASQRLFFDLRARLVTFLQKEVSAVYDPSWHEEVARQQRKQCLCCGTNKRYIGLCRMCTRGAYTDLGEVQPLLRCSDCGGTGTLVDGLGCGLCHGTGIDFGKLRSKLAETLDQV